MTQTQPEQRMNLWRVVSTALIISAGILFFFIGILIAKTASADFWQTALLRIVSSFVGIPCYFYLLFEKTKKTRTYLLVMLAIAAVTGVLAETLFVTRSLGDLITITAIMSGGYALEMLTYWLFSVRQRHVELNILGRSVDLSVWLADVTPTLFCVALFYIFFGLPRAVLASGLFVAFYLFSGFIKKVVNDTTSILETAGTTLFLFYFPLSFILGILTTR